MRILQVSDSYPPATGGLERTVQLLARELAHRDHRVDVATLSYPDTPARRAKDRSRCTGWTAGAGTCGGFPPTPGTTSTPAPDPLLVRRLQALVDELHPEVVHAHGWILHSCLGLRLPPGSALVVTLHDYSLVCAKKTMIRHGELDRRCPARSLRGCCPARAGTTARSRACRWCWGSRRRTTDSTGSRCSCDQ